MAAPDKTEEKLPESPSPEQVMANQRGQLSAVIRVLRLAEKTATPPAVQEIVLARRDAESARMRLGVAMTYMKGEDPFANTKPKKAEETPTEEK